MSRKRFQHKNEFLPLIFTKIPPNKAVQDYYNSKSVIEDPKKNWLWDNAKNDPVMRCVQEVALLHHNDTMLAEKREYMKKKRIDLDNEWKDLGRKEESFRDSFIRFNRFVRENIEKRERACIKTGEQYMLRHQRDHDIKMLTNRFDLLKEVKKAMDIKMKQYRVYEAYLDTLLNGESEFKNLTDIINRYETLVVTRKKLAIKQENDLTALENARTTAVKYIEAQVLVVLGLNNRIAALQLRHGKAHSKCIKWETMTAVIKQNIIEKLKEAVLIRLNCRNLYLKMCDRKKVAADLRSYDHEGQFVFIKKTLVDLNRISSNLNPDKTVSKQISERSIMSRMKRHM